MHNNSKRNINMKLKFTINKKYDWECTKRFNPGLQKKDFDNKYAVLQVPLKWTQEAFQNNWDLINDDFSEYIIEKTGYKWFHEEYECVLSVEHRGLSNWGRSNMIVRAWWENPYAARRITAHEIILSHYFYIYRRFFSDYKFKDGQVWALAEIAAFALTSLTDNVKKYWPWYTAYYTDHNYPHIVDIQNELKDVFLNMQDFNEYIREGLELIKKYPDMNPSGR